MQQFHKRILGVLMQGNHNKAAMKSTSGVPSERVIAISNRDNTLATLNDSVSFKYGANKGSSYDFNTMIYAYNYPYYTSPVFSFAGIFSKPQLFFDTMRHWTVNPNTLVYGYYETDYATYDVNKNTTAYTELYKDSAIYPNMKFINKFTVANNIDTGYAFNYIAGHSDSAFKQFYAYNTMNRLTKDSTYEYHGGSWHLVSKTLYTYNVSNDLIQVDNYSNTTDTTFTLPLIEQLQYINTYDASHRLLTVASSYYNGTIFAPYVRDTMTYTGTHTYHSTWKEYQYDPINTYWAPMSYMSKHLNLAGYPDTVYINGFDSLLNAWIPQTMDVVHYNTFNDPDTLKDYEYNFTAYPATPDFTTIYYYQSYLITTGTELTPEIQDEVVIYPNPLTDHFTISQLNVAPDARISVSIINSLGQIISRETMNWQGNKQIETAALAPGTYWVLISDGQGKILHRKSIIKQ